MIPGLASRIEAQLLEREVFAKDIGTNLPVAIQQKTCLTAANYQVANYSLVASVVRHVARGSPKTRC